jgi:hypothetical protein
MLVALNTTVTLILFTANGGSEQMTVHLVSDSRADYARGLFGANTPLGRALLGHAEDETLPYPEGDVVRLYIVSVQPLQTDAPEKSAEDVIKQAVTDINHTNAVLFASSYSSKWGDYDPDGIDHPDDAHPAKDDPES